MTTGLLPWEESPDSDKLTWIYVFRTLDLVFRCLWSEVSKPNHSFRCLWNVSYITCITITGSIPLVEQELLAIPEHLSSPRVFSGVRVTRSLVLCVCFVYCSLSFFFCHFVVCSSSIYRFGLPLWYLQALLCYRPISPRGHHPLSSQCCRTDMDY